MATRATYKFETNKVTTTVYIHHDGYPQGAAHYFDQMLSNPSKGDLATQFIRANPNSEITGSHKAHGDTEFHYDISGYDAEANIEAYEVDRSEEQANGLVKTKCFFSGKLFEFVNKYSNLIEDFKPYKKVDGLFSNLVLNEKTAEIRLRNPLHHLQRWKGTEHENSYNWQSCLEETHKILQWFPELKKGEVLEFVS